MLPAFAHAVPSAWYTASGEPSDPGLVRVLPAHHPPHSPCSPGPVHLYVSTQLTVLSVSPALDCAGSVGVSFLCLNTRCLTCAWMNGQIVPLSWNPAGPRGLGGLRQGSLWGQLEVVRRLLSEVSSC